MKLPAVSFNATGVLAIAGVVVGGIVLYKLLNIGKGASQAVGQAVDAIVAGAGQAMANVTQTWNNATSAPPAPGEKAFLYSNEGYTGIDPSTGKLPTDGQWYGNPDARQYSYTQRDAGGAPAAESIDGAAFGIYPSAGRRKVPAPGPTTGDFARLDRFLIPDENTLFNPQAGP